MPKTEVKLIKKDDPTQPKRKVIETFFAISAPENLFVWSARNPWTFEDFIDCGYRIEQINFVGDATTKSDQITWKKAKPKILPSRKRIYKGNSVTKLTTSASFSLQPDTFDEFSEILNELSEEYKISTWQIQSMVLYDTNRAMKLHFKRFDPDGEGTKLYCEKYGERLYKEVPVAEQQNILGHFGDYLAGCEIAEEISKVTRCVIRRRLREGQPIQ